jgi:hypothetical protein
VGLRDRISTLGRSVVSAGLDRAEARLSAFRSETASIRSEPRSTPDPDGAPSAEAVRTGNVPGAKAIHEAAMDVDWTSEDAMGLMALAKAQDEAGNDLGSPKGLYWDPYSLVEQLGYKERPSAITYATLNAMVWKVPVINAVIQTRINQVAAFCTPQASKFGHGFRVRMRDAEAKPTPADKKEARRLERFLETTGYTDDPRTRPTFEQLMRKTTRDTLTYDQVNWEIVPNRKGEPAAWYAADPATIKLADTYRLAPSEDLDATRCVQIYDQVVVNEFSGREMIFEIRNPRTDIRSQGYGTSEIEMLVSTVTQLLWAVNHNANYFSQGTAVPGLLNLKGAIPEKQMRAFRREWFQMISGNENAWRTPITNAEEIQWIPMLPSNQDMEFSHWLDFLIKIVCGVFLMDPVEINFKFGAGGQRSMFGAADRAKVVESQQRGLHPLLRFYESILNRWILWPTNEEFVVEFIGLERMTPKELADLNTQRVRTLYTIDEMRAENDLEPLPDGKGQVILDANWLAHDRQLEQQRQAHEQELAQIQAQGEGNQEAEGPPPIKDQMPGQETPPAPAQDVGKLEGDPATPDQIKELEALLQPSTTNKSFGGVEDIVTIEVEL